MFVLDTGIYKDHNEFTGGGAADGTKVVGHYSAITGTTSASDTNDVDGHGTHCAGTVAGNRYGVAVGANLYAVKVLGDDGSGTGTDFLEGAVLDPTCKTIFLVLSLRYFR